jgi:hypothetical protein
LWDHEVKTLLDDAGFYIQEESTFELKLNKIYTARKKAIALTR